MIKIKLGFLTSDSSGQQHILGHDGDPFGVNRTQIGVLKEPDQVGFRGLLERENGRGLESEPFGKLLGDLADQALERELSHQQLGALLVLSDLSERHRARSVSVRLFRDSLGGLNRLLDRLGGVLLVWDGLSRDLFRSCHGIL